MPDGLSTFDLLGDMPSNERALLRIFLRRVEMDEAQIAAAVAELPAEKRLTPEQMRDTLKALIEKGSIEKKTAFWSRKVTYRIHQAKKSVF
jgi:hypothetical protein